jgi:hypothetical protein
MVTREALRILHQKLNFIANINRTYDDSFAVAGAKIGSSLKIRLPNQYTVRTGATFTTQAVVESSVTLTVATQKGVDTEFTSADLALSLDDFSKRILSPAMAVLAAGVESDALSMKNDVYNTIDNTTNASVSMSNILAARQRLNDTLAPQDDNRTALLTTQDSADLVNALKGLFQDANAIKQQYREGMMGRTGGFDFYENTLLTNLTSGTHSATSTMIVTDTIVPATAQSTITVNQSTAPGTFVVGDVFTIATLNRVHPESKADTGVLQQFVVTAANVVGSTSTTSSIAFSPSIVMSGATQNVISTAISGQLLTKIGNTSRVLRQSLCFHKDAFAFVSADLVLPKGLHFAAREVQDGISMRVLSDYAMTSDTIGTRIDILYGYKTIRPELAVKISS